jgi:hypothetical protein
MESNVRNNKMMMLAIGGVVAVVVVIIIIVVATSGKSSSSSPTTSAPTVVVNVTTPAPQALVKTVLLERPSDKAIMIADILLYDDQNVLIPSSNITATVTPQLDNSLYPSFVAGFGPGNLLDNNTATFAHTVAGSTQNMKLVLTNPMKIKRIVIKNRVDGGQADIATVSVRTLNINDVELSKTILTGASLIYELSYDPSSGAFGNVVPS